MPGERCGRVIEDEDPLEWEAAAFDFVEVFQPSNRLRGRGFFWG